MPIFRKKKSSKEKGNKMDKGKFNLVLRIQSSLKLMKEMKHQSKHRRD